ncbi:DUF6476 family protein [Roseomonas sp. E05]|uniref:DUF6476 family protein n=1 Tax=Roseomonas sp. E05 TaxID=3046310 RepID=UPI0024BB837A|nr:DUF6476 family protein [Roseomonas sp. E05]MDJ0390534.1 DUF6476 family protein [Roseomonas sp. E05]
MRALKILVVVMGVMIIVGAVALVVALVQRSHTAMSGLTSPVSTDLALRQPPGTQIGQIAVLNGQLAIWVERPDGGRILLVDPQGGRVAGEIRLGE